MQEQTYTKKYIYFIYLLFSLWMSTFSDINGPTYLLTFYCHFQLRCLHLKSFDFEVCLKFENWIISLKMHNLYCGIMTIEKKTLLSFCKWTFIFINHLLLILTENRKCLPFMRYRANVSRYIYKKNIFLYIALLQQSRNAFNKAFKILFLI